MKAITTKDAHAQFTKYLTDKKRSTSTIVAYGKDIEQLVAFLEEMSKHHVHEVTKEDIEKLIRDIESGTMPTKAKARKATRRKLVIKSVRE